MVQIGACAAVLVAWVTPAHSAPAACVVAWRNGDNLVKAGQLRAAKTQMLKCAHYTCGGNLSKECGRRVVEIEADIPTIVPVVKNEDGEPVTDLSLAMDGEIIANQIDGRAVMVDPGTHEFTFQTARGVLARYKTVILQGQRNRTVEVSLRDDDSPMVKTRVPPGSMVAAAMNQQRGGSDPGSPELNFIPDEGEEEPGGRRFTTGTLTMAGIGALGIAGYSLGNYYGNKENASLADCGQMCSQAQLNRPGSYYQAAKISLGLGIAALAGAAYLYFTSGSSADATEEMASNRSKFRLDLQPTAAGGLAGFSGSF